VQIHGSNGASIGAQIEGGSMVLPGTSTTNHAPKLDLWTIKGEESLIEQWNESDIEAFLSTDGTSYFFTQQLIDFKEAIIEKRQPLVTAIEGRKTVEIFTAIYLSQRDGRPVIFPLKS